MNIKIWLLVTCMHFSAISCARAKAQDTALSADSGRNEDLLCELPEEASKHKSLIFFGEAGMRIQEGMEVVLPPSDGTAVYGLSVANDFCAPMYICGIGLEKSTGGLACESGNQVRASCKSFTGAWLLPAADCGGSNDRAGCELHLVVVWGGSSFVGASQADLIVRFGQTAEDCAVVPEFRSVHFSLLSK